MKIFVAGATGALGRRLVPLLVSNGHTVVGTTRTPDKAEALRAAQLTALAGFSDFPQARGGLRSHQPAPHPHPGNRSPARGHPATPRSADRRPVLRRAGLLRPHRWAHQDRERPVRPRSPCRPAANRGGRALPGASGPGGRGDRGDRPSLRRLLRSGHLGRRGRLPARGRPASPVPIVAAGTGGWSFIHIDDAATATLAAIERGRTGVYNIVDDDPAPVAEWLPVLAAAIGAKPPWRVPAWLARLFVGEHGVVMVTESRGASNAKAQRELGWRPAYPSWRTGFRVGEAAPKPPGRPEPQAGPLHGIVRLAQPAEIR